MAPQATAPPKSDQEKQAEDQARKQAEKEWAELVQRASDGDTPAARQVQRALSLERERAAVLKRIADNREYLRLMDRNEELNENQVRFLDTFYPEKEKGERRSQAEIEATRKAREAAHRDGKKS